MPCKDVFPGRNYASTYGMKAYSVSNSDYKIIQGGFSFFNSLRCKIRPVGNITGLKPVLPR
jgi:hypothetical protein